MWTRDELRQVKEFLAQCVNDADKQIIDAIKRNDGQFGSREQLLAELDALDIVRERLDVRVEQYYD